MEEKDVEYKDITQDIENMKTEIEKLIKQKDLLKKLIEDIKNIKW